MRGGHKAHSGLIPTLRYTSEPLSDPSHLKAFVRAKKSPASGGGRGSGMMPCRVRPQAPAVFGGQIKLTRWLARSPALLTGCAFACDF